MKEKFDKIVKFIEENEINVYGFTMNEKANKYKYEKISERVNVYSIGKSITALCIFILEDRKELSLDDKLVSFFPQFSYANGTEKITIQNLLDMASTKDCSWIGDFPNSDEDYLGRFFEHECTLVEGTFRYSNFCSYALGRIVSKLTSKTVLEFARINIFEPLGIETPRWSTCNSGYTACANNLFLNIDELSKITDILLNNGSFEGRQIVDSKHFDRFKKSFTVLEKEKEYQHSFWNIDIKDGYFMKGIYSNFVMVIPELEIGFTMTALEKDNSKRDMLIDFIKEQF